MAKKKSSKKSKKQSSASNKSGAQWLLVDPARVRFQHSRIRPYFSGCGRSVQDTLEEIRNKELSPSDLPHIQVIVGPEDEDGPWYFSLNNRRLWVLKRCREEGLLKDNQIRVRVRQPKSGSEEERYTLENCAIEAKFIREKDPKRNESKDSPVDAQREPLEGEETNPPSRKNSDSDKISGVTLDVGDKNEEFDEGSVSESDESSSEEGVTMNRFSVLLT